ncbi:hypothetical protein G3T20_10135 [Bordetella hinzii]|uniref:hypothetical protein n=1 Tax=Bordetella hinzii TaxID=103855 RepID=UPI0013EFDCBF|nr:hypothetical protein [Bordetella hinzii]QII85000.1 hypothetical protein G3T20_10135 [Bordetella hinzii]
MLDKGHDAGAVGKKEEQNVILPAWRGKPGPNPKEADFPREAPAGLSCYKIIQKGGRTSIATQHIPPGQTFP